MRPFSLMLFTRLRFHVSLSVSRGLSLFSHFPNFLFLYFHLFSAAQTLLPLKRPPRSRLFRVTKHLATSACALMHQTWWTARNALSSRYKMHVVRSLLCLSILFSSANSVRSNSICSWPTFKLIVDHVQQSSTLCVSRRKLLETYIYVLFNNASMIVSKFVLLDFNRRTLHSKLLLLFCKHDASILRQQACITCTSYDFIHKLMGIKSIERKL